MIYKQLQKKIDLFPKDFSNELMAPIELEYYLLESDGFECSELAGKKVYGVEIVKKVGYENFESEIVRNLSCCKDSVRKIVNKLAENTVTPVGLPFILDDLIGI